MIKTLKYGSCMLFFLTFLLACRSEIDAKTDLDSLYKLIDKYEPLEEHEHFKIRKNYPIGDSLDSYFNNVNPNIVMNDTNFRKAILYLLEKKYLYMTGGLANKDAFYISNASNWGGDSKYIQFSLNIFNKMPSDKNGLYSNYVEKIKDKTCIDSIVKEMQTYYLFYEQQKKVHAKCLLLMPSGCSK